MAGIREQKKKATMDAIKAAAVKLFTEKGYERTSIEDISKAAGIGKTTIYGYFPTKDKIFRDYCFDEFYKSFMEIQDQTFADHALLDNLVSFFMMQVKFITRNHELGRQLMREMTFPESIDDKQRENDQHYFEILGNYFKIAADKGEIRPDYDEENMIYHFYSVYLGAMTGWYTGYLHDYEQVETVMRKVFHQALEGITKC
jgi:AcrR family transcriptional regulator